MIVSCGCWNTFKTQAALRSAVYAVRWLIAVNTGAYPTQALVVSKRWPNHNHLMHTWPRTIGKNLCNLWMFPLVLARCFTLISYCIWFGGLISPHTLFLFGGAALQSSHLSCSHCSGDQCRCCNFLDGTRYLKIISGSCNKQNQQKRITLLCNTYDLCTIH